MAIANAPADAHCVRINAAASATTVSSSFTLTPGASSVLTMPAIPAGQVTFTADVFPVACAAVTSASTPTWVSDSTTVSIVSGQANHVTLTMRRPDQTEVTLDFPDDGGTPQPPAAPPPATAMVGAGQVASSPNFKMIFTLGQPSPQQGTASSPGHVLRGGLSGANGSAP